MTTLIAPALTLGDATLHECGKFHHPDGFTVSVSRDGLSFGSSEAVQTVVESLWADGASVSQRATNAVTSFRVMIEGPDLTTLAAGEAYVRRAFPADRGSVDLVWRPGEGAPAAVRTVLAGELGAPDPDLYAETGVLMRRVYPLELTHAPFVRSEHETVVSAQESGVGETPLTLYNGGAATGWGSNPSGKLTSTSGQIRAGDGATIVWSGSWDLGGRRLLYVRRDWATGHTISVRRGTGPYQTYSPIGSAGFAYVYRLDESSLPVTAIGFYPLAGVQVHTVLAVQARFEFEPTGRQSLRRFTVGGTERSPGTLQVSTRDGAGSLGTTIVHTGPDEGAYDPDLLAGRWLEGGVSWTPDPAAPGGGWLAGSILLSSRPAAGIPPGSYMLTAWMAAASGTVTINPTSVAVTVGDGGDTAPWMATAPHVNIAPVTLTTTPRLVWLGTVEWGADAGVGTSWVVLNGATGAKVGGWWAFPHGRGTSLTAVDSDRPHAWVSSGDIMRGARVHIGATDDPALSYTPNPTAIHTLDAAPLPAGPARSYVVTTGAANAAVSYRYVKRWTHLPADDGTTP